MRFDGTTKEVAKCMQKYSGFSQCRGADGHTLPACMNLLLLRRHLKLEIVAKCRDMSVLSTMAMTSFRMCRTTSMGRRSIKLHLCPKHHSAQSLSAAGSSWHFLQLPADFTATASRPSAKLVLRVIHPLARSLSSTWQLLTNLQHNSNSYHWVQLCKA